MKQVLIKVWMYLETIILLTFLVFGLGFFAPQLISAKDSFSVVIGFGFCSIAMPLVVLMWYWDIRKRLSVLKQLNIHEGEKDA